MISGSISLRTTRNAHVLNTTLLWGHSSASAGMLQTWFKSSTLALCSYFLKMFFNLLVYRYWLVATSSYHYNCRSDSFTAMGNFVISNLDRVYALHWLTLSRTFSTDYNSITLMHCNTVTVH